VTAPAASHDRTTGRWDAPGRITHGFVALAAGEGMLAHGTRRTVRA
jgi:hypothetical protein